MKNVTVEEKRVLLQSLKESNNGDKDRTIIDFDLIQSCIAVMRSHSLIPQKRKGSKVALNEQIENLLDLAFHKEMALDTIEPVVLRVADVKRILYNFTFTYKKSKGGDAKKRIHVDKYSTSAFDESTALVGLKTRLKNLKEVLISVESTDKKHFSYEMVDGSIVFKRDVVGFVEG